MTAVVLIGNVIDYQTKYNLLEREIKKGNISIISVLFQDNVKFNVVDSFDIVNSLDGLKDKDFDYFILLTENNNVYHEILKQGFNQEIIPIKVFELPNFDFSKYKKLLKNPPSVISRHCWGGMLLNRLGLRFNSPFINLFLLDTDFNKLAKNFSYYMNQELVFDREEYEHTLKRNYPVAKLDDISIYFNHYSNFEEAKTKWDERKKRINYSNLFFETTTENKNVALEFDDIDLKHKLCFFWGRVDSPDIIDFSRFMESEKKGTLGMVVNYTANGTIPYFDLIELLLNFNYESRIEFK